MLVNQYRLTSELTGEVITGTRAELEQGRNWSVWE
nr:MAG TPA: hypothetical protein [Caudoviricetes sp.]